MSTAITARLWPLEQLLRAGGAGQALQSSQERAGGGLGSCLSPLHTQGLDQSQASLGMDLAGDAPAVRVFSLMWHLLAWGDL